MATSKPANGNDRFNAEAAAWDSNPEVHNASALAFQSLRDHFPILKNHHPGSTTGLDVLEIGCGTGLLSFMIAPSVRSLTAVDTASGMIDAFKLKLAAQHVQNMLPVCVMLTDPDDELIRPDPVTQESLSKNKTDLPPRRFDLVISHLVLHHISSLSEILATMHGCLKSGGRVALTDFEDFGPEARKFHPESRMDGVERHGIRRADMEVLLREAGFVDVSIETAFQMEKKVESKPGEGVRQGDEAAKMMFPFLICLGKKA